MTWTQPSCLWFLWERICWVITCCLFIVTETPLWNLQTEYRSSAELSSAAAQPGVMTNDGPSIKPCYRAGTQRTWRLQKSHVIHAWEAAWEFHKLATYRTWGFGSHTLDLAEAIFLLTIYYMIYLFQFNVTKCRRETFSLPVLTFCSYFLFSLTLEQLYMLVCVGVGGGVIG